MTLTICPRFCCLTQGVQSRPYRKSSLRKLRKPPPWPARPIPRQVRGQGGKGGNPFFGPYSDTKVFLGAIGRKNGTTVVQLDSSSAVWRANGELAAVGFMVPTYSGGRGDAPRAIRKFPIFSMRESRKSPAMVLTYSAFCVPRF